MNPHPVRQSAFFAALAVLACLSIAGRAAAAGAPVMPAYDEDGRLLLPQGYEEWIYVGASLGLSYTEGPAGMEMFHHTLMEPTAYQHFKRTGEFREGTMFVLSLHGQGEAELPQRRGRFESDLHGIEMAVKDSRTFADGWAYFGFGGMDGVRDRAQAFNGDSCDSCHSTQGAYDNVFLQFYPALAAAAPAGSPAFAALASRREEAQANRRAEAGDEAEEEQAGEEEAKEPVLALRGLDPVLLTEGREEMGKPEIVETFGAYRYQFVSEPTRARFAGDRERFSIQNKTCPVFPGTPTDPGLFTVYDGKIYTFATPSCVDQFKANPDSFLPTD